MDLDVIGVHSRLIIKAKTEIALLQAVARKGVFLYNLWDNVFG